MRFNYAGRAQSDGRIKCETCGHPMLGVGESDFKDWPGIAEVKFCECPEQVLAKTARCQKCDGSERAFQPGRMVDCTCVANTETDWESKFRDALVLLKDRDEEIARLKETITHDVDKIEAQYTAENKLLSEGLEGALARLTKTMRHWNESMAREKQLREALENARSRFQLIDEKCRDIHPVDVIALDGIKAINRALSLKARGGE